MWNGLGEHETITIKPGLGKVLFVGLTTVMACIAWFAYSQENASQLNRLGNHLLAAKGEQLFSEATFSGNDRTCHTCHALEQFGTITPETVQALYASNPGAPLFRALDSDDGLGTSYQRLLEHATIRVPLDLPVDSASGLSIRKCEAPAETKTTVNRGNPSVFNVALENHLMHDGRNGDDLRQQARDAIQTHNQPTSKPADIELAAIVAFQKTLFSKQSIKEFFISGKVPAIPVGTTASEIRGRSFLAEDGKCGVCHSGPLLNQTSKFHGFVVGARFETALVGMEPDNPNPKYLWCWVDPKTNKIVTGPNGETQINPQPMADPGTILSNNTQEFTGIEGKTFTVSNAQMAIAVGGPVFKIPTLWGVVNTAPYFHDNSAKTLEDVIDQYNFLFKTFTEFASDLGCQPAPSDCFDERDKKDIIAYLQLLAFDSP